ncbi:MAG: M48 family metallopeptidase [Firmicutes bacterium]|uniref:YgjP-like metallopeptidase domain-containing protein n=1 Tax=Sulfobacillus benefaciens TaxID=453960 RepID=A0A2T2X999_9FIRM|nr:M48 family metallopeptidase [Bacillota bacterium]PSR31093.1 MAG: hypothetical protein C7B43_03055 [Sulfobacillus benefaciens]
MRLRVSGRTTGEEISGSQELCIGSTRIVYQVVCRPRRRRAVLQFGEDGALKVLVPPGYSLDHVQEFVAHNTPWILRNYHKYRDRQPKTFLSGEQFFLAGISLTLVVREASKARVITDNNDLIVEIPGREEFALENVRNQLIRWYRTQAVSQLLPRVNFWARRVGRYPSRVKIHEYRTRWGYCRQDGLIALNWRIVQAPGPVVDYVVVHELTHLTHPHHQNGFWQALSLVLPGYESPKQWLKEQGYRLQW